jgi:hypothetical protein
MKKYVRCKVCGFIMEEGKLHDKCPACGVLAKMFEPYVEKMSEKRKSILDLHIHPIIVHMPQALAFFLLLSFLTLIFLPENLKESFTLTLKIISICLPVSLIGAILSGLLDGKIRFKKVTTPILINKIITGNIFFILSLIISLATIIFNASQLLNNIILIVLSIACFLCSWILGSLGASLVESKFPG